MQPSGVEQQMIDRLLSLFKGTAGFVAAMFMLAAYVILALYPFHWTLPRRLPNGVVQAADGVLRFSVPGIARSRVPPDGIREAKTNGAIVIELCVRTLSPDQMGPARLFTISADTYQRNLTIDQVGPDLVLRLRTHLTSSDGVPHYRQYQFRDVFATTKWRNLDLRISPRALEFTVQNKSLLSEELPLQPLESWNAKFDIAFGNEMTGDHPWLGEISTGVIRRAGKRIDCLRHCGLEKPRHYWQGRFKAFVFDPPMIIDALVNFVCFVPLGFVLAALHGGRGSFIVTVATCALVSFLVEVTQIAIDLRVPSFMDVLLNVGGATVGAWLAGWLVNRKGRRWDDTTSHEAVASPR